MWEAAEKDADLKDNARHYMDVIRSAFETEDVKIDKPEIIAKYEARGFKVGAIRMDDNGKTKWAFKKRPILRVTDLTYENIHHITAAKLIEVLDRNFGGGWESLSQSIRDIIENGFDISTTTLPKDRLHKPGGMYEKKVNDGFEVLEIAKGTWIEAIFAKAKPETIKSVPMLDDDVETDELSLAHEVGEELLPEELESETFDDDDDDDTFDEDKLTEESYRTTFETDPEDLSLEAEDVSDEDDNF